MILPFEEPFYHKGGGRREKGSAETQFKKIRQLRKWLDLRPRAGPRLYLFKGRRGLQDQRIGVPAPHNL